MESQKINAEFWNNKIENININYRDPKRFWEDIKKMQGSSKTSPPYLVDEQNRKIKETEGKEELFRNTWQNILRISDEENRSFDMQHEDNINRYINDNRYRLKPYQLANLNRLDENNYLTKPIKTEDIIKTLKNFKNKAPGESQIGKTLLTNLPEQCTINSKNY